MSDIKHDNEGRKGTFYVEDGGKRIAELAYMKADSSTINVYHTEVSESHRGGSIGHDLVDAAVEFARKDGLKVKADCPYAHRVLAKDEKYSNVFVDAQGE